MPTVSMQIEGRIHFVFFEKSHRDLFTKGFAEKMRAEISAPALVIFKAIQVLCVGLIIENQPSASQQSALTRLFRAPRKSNLSRGIGC